MADFVDGSAMQGSAVNKRLRLVVGYTKGAIPEARRGNRGTGRPPGASQPPTGRYFSKENSKKRTVD